MFKIRKGEKMENEFITSFEVADGGAVGDIVSKDRKNARKRLKVGLLPLSWFEWCRCIPKADSRRKSRATATSLLR